MAYRITARINAETGEFEVFQVDDLAVAGAGAEHDAAHEQAATAIGSLVERRPGIEEVTPGGLAASGDPVLGLGTASEKQTPTGWGLEDGSSSGARPLKGGGWGLEDG